MTYWCVSGISDEEISSGFIRRDSQKERDYPKPSDLVFSVHNRELRHVGRVKPLVIKIGAICNPKPPVSAPMVHAWVANMAGGDYNNVRVEPLIQNITADAVPGKPLPFLAKGEGKRADIVSALAGQHHGYVSFPTPLRKHFLESRSLSDFLRYSATLGASRLKIEDLLAVLNGGFNSSSRYWGRSYIELVVTKGQTGEEKQPTSECSVLPMEWLKLKEAVPVLDMQIKGISSPVPVIIQDKEGASLRERIRSLIDGELNDSGHDRLEQSTEQETAEQIRVDVHLAPTEREAVIKARYGQGKYRQNVQAIEKRCRVTGVSDLRLLRASHIKPWRDCETDAERLDGCNGLLLAPHIDHLFDRGYLTFEDDGRVRLSSVIDSKQLRRLGLIPERIIKPSLFLPEQKAYLAYHRTHIFQETENT
jgi:hypothetical protein